jgi:hypothetical protein
MALPTAEQLNKDLDTIFRNIEAMEQRTMAPPLDVWAYQPNHYALKDNCWMLNLTEAIGLKCASPILYDFNRLKMIAPPVEFGVQDPNPSANRLPFIDLHREICSDIYNERFLTIKSTNGLEVYLIYGLYRTVVNQPKNEKESIDIYAYILYNNTVKNELQKQFNSYKTKVPELFYI